MKLLILAAILSLIGGAAALAGGCETNSCSITPIDESTNSASSSTNLSVPVTTQNKSNQSNELRQDQSGVLQNTQVNVNNIGSYSFGNGIECATPGIAVSGFGNALGGSTGVGATVSYVVPLGGRISENCKSITTEILKQRQLDTSYVFISKCIDFARAGVRIDYEVFPELLACRGVIIQPPVVTPPTPPIVVSPPVKLPAPPVRVIVPPDDSTPKRPVRAMW